MTPTARTLKFLREHGHDACVVERWNPHSRTRHDAFGIIDILCVPLSGKGIIGVQACAGASHAARRTKSLAEPRLLTWLNAGGRFQVISWAKQGPRGKRKTWVPRVEEIQSVEVRACTGRLAVRPIELADANEFVARLHRHHEPVVAT